jgi:protein phosphatase 1 regulatory subunit 7
MSTLTELDLYDNQIEQIRGLNSLVNLEILDLSYNRIRVIEGRIDLKTSNISLFIQALQI